MSKVILVAVDIRSSHNVGSLFRTCDGFGADLALVGICPRPLSTNDDRLPHIAKKADSAIAKTALGAEKSVKWRYFSNFDSCIKTLRDEGNRIIAVEQASNSKSIHRLELNESLALIVGREVEGLSPEEINLCDDVYEIPMKCKKESFNVSVAAGIALYQISK
jgi:tRNA G18 (ribose-2'-O)-methylase SpoU